MLRYVALEYHCDGRPQNMLLTHLCHKRFEEIFINLVETLGRTHYFWEKYPPTPYNHKTE